MDRLDIPVQDWFDSAGLPLVLSKKGTLSTRDDQGTKTKDVFSSPTDVLQVLPLAGKRHVLMRSRSESRVVDTQGQMPDLVLGVMPRVVAGLFLFPNEAWLMMEDGAIDRWEAGRKRERIPLVWSVDAPQVERAVFAEEGERVFTLSPKDNVVRVWNRVTGQQIASLADVNGHQRAVTSFDVIKDGSLVATGGEDKRWVVWQMDTMGVATVLAYKEATSIVRAMALASDGKSLVTGHDDGTVKVWTSYVSAIPFYASQRFWYEGRSFYGHAGAVVDVQLRLDGQRIMSLGSDQTVRLWKNDPDTVIPIYRSALQLDVSAQSDRVLTMELDSKVRLWNTQDLLTQPNPQPLAVLSSSHTRGYLDARFHPSGRFVAASTWAERSDREESKLDLWDVSNPAQPQLVNTIRSVTAIDFDGVFRTYIGAVFSPDGKYMLNEEDTSLGCSNLNVWDVAQLATGGSGVPAVRASCTHFDWKSFSFDSRYLVGSKVLGGDASFKIWETQPAGSLFLRATVKDATPPVIASFTREVFSPDGKQLYSLDVRSELAIWNLADVTNPTLIKAMSDTQIGNLTKITSMDMANDGILALHHSANSISGTVYLFDTKNQRHLASKVVVFPDTGDSSVGSSRSRMLPDGSGALMLYNQVVQQMYFWATPKMEQLFLLKTEDL